MSDTQKDIAALIGSRICHDLISPLGAIGNGVELLGMSGANDGPEMALINESVMSANARIRFFRVAFGAAMPGHKICRNDIRSILTDITRGGRVSIDWDVAGDVPRDQVKLAFLLIQCFESALPYGGSIQVECNQGRWLMQCQSKRMKIDPAIWEALISADIEKDISPAEVHFALVPDAVRRAGCKLQADLQETAITLVF